MRRRNTSSVRVSAVVSALLLAGLGSTAHAQAGSGMPSFPEFPSDSPRPIPSMRQPVFFPPNPPPLGRVIGRAVAPSENRVPAPAGLAPYVNEIFYPALGARLISNSLKEPLRQQLERYRAAKLTLQSEIRAEVARLRDAEPAARTEALRKFAATQAARLVQLEKDAEQLRRELTLSDYTWGAIREWRLGDRDRRGFSPFEIAQVMRAYAFHQNGLLPAQRRLLREISIELIMAAEDRDKATAAQPHVFFPPEPARVLFPDDMSAEAAAKLAAFQTKKSQLKKELYDAIYKHDGETFGFLTGNTISNLANKQSARLVELEMLAEEVRRLLPSTASKATSSERSPLTVALNARVGAMMNGYLAAQKDAATRIDAIVTAAKGVPFQSNYRFDAEGLKFLVVPSRMAGRDPEVLKRIERIRGEISAVAEDYGRKLAELVNERASLRTAIAETLGITKEDAVDQALFAAMRVINQQQTEAGYEEYRVAVFEPGLSPEQRRVLFDSVVEKLDLPLPRGEPQPIRRANSW